MVIFFFLQISLNEFIRLIFVKINKENTNKKVEPYIIFHICRSITFCAIHSNNSHPYILFSGIYKYFPL